MEVVLLNQILKRLVNSMVSLRMCSPKPGKGKRGLYYTSLPTLNIARSLLNRKAPFMEDIVVSKEGVTKVPKGLNPSKALGPDELHPRVLKELTSELGPVFAHLFQQSVDSGEFSKEYCYERDFMDSLNDDNQADVIEAFNSTSRYLDDLLNIDNPYFEGMVNQIYPPELQLNKANISDTEAPFLDLHLSVANGFVSSKIYDKRDDFDFDIVNFPFLDGDVPRRASYGVYISQLIRFARVCNHVTDFNARNKCLTAKLLQQGYRYHKLRKTFSKFYRRHYELISKYNVGLKTLLSEGLSEPEFYGDLVYKFKKLKGINDFSFQFRKIITRYRRIGYNLNVMRQSACLVFNPIMVDNYAAFFNCTPVGRASDSMMAPT